MIWTNFQINKQNATVIIESTHIEPYLNDKIAGSITGQTLEKQ